MNPALLQVVVAEAPALIAALKDAFAKQNPNAPAPSDADVIAAFNAAYALSVAKDESWLNAHPSSATDAAPASS